MNPIDVGFLAFLAMCMLAIAYTGWKCLPAPEPEPLPEGKVTGFDLRVELREPRDVEDMHHIAQALIDHLQETFNDDDTIRYISYDVPQTELPE